MSIQTATAARPKEGIWQNLAATFRRIPLHAVVIGICLIWLVPSIGLLASSFRPPRLVGSSGWWTVLLLPRQFTFENYGEVLQTYNMGRSLLNSLFITIPATVIPIMVAAYAAYAFAWMRFWGRELLFTIVVGSLVIPLQMTLIPVLRLFNAAGLVGTFPAVWLAHTGYGLPFAVYLLRNFIGALPKDLIESAYVDGAGPLTVFFRLIFPLTIPSIASLVIFQFLWVWNDLLVALIFVGGDPRVAPMTVTVSNLVNSLGQNWQLLTAAAFVSMLLPMIVFFALQQYFVRGILAGAIKG